MPVAAAAAGAQDAAAGEAAKRLGAIWLEPEGEADIACERPERGPNVTSGESPRARGGRRRTRTSSEACMTDDPELSSAERDELRKLCDEYVVATGCVAKALRVANPIEPGRVQLILKEEHRVATIMAGIKEILRADQVSGNPSESPSENRDRRRRR